MSYNPNLVGFPGTAIPFPLMLTTLGMAVVLGALASLYPSWRALRLKRRRSPPLRVTAVPTSPSP